MNGLIFLPKSTNAAFAQEAGFRFGAVGTHTSRTMMFDELNTLLDCVPSSARRDDYADAIIGANCLGKQTTSTRRLTNQRLAELYGLDPSIPLFTVLRRLWALEPSGRRLLAMQCAIARDPTLAATAPSVLPLREGAEFQRDAMHDCLRRFVGERLNDAILAKVVRNAASSWTQSGHLEGRTFKRRKIVNATTANGAFSLFLGHLAGFQGEEIFKCAWMRVLDCTPASARDLAFAAKRAGLIDLRVAAEVVELKLERLDPRGAS